MNSAPLQKAVLSWTALAMVVVLPIAWHLGQLPMLLGALGGCGLGLANFAALVWLSKRMFASSGRNKGAAGVMLVGKLGLMMLGSFVAVRVFGLDVYGFLMGFSALVLALFVGGSQAALGELEKE